MPVSPHLPDLTDVYSLAMREARRLTRSLRLPAHEAADLCQDLLADFLGRLPSYDPAKGALAAFAMLCFRHAGFRIAKQIRQGRRARHICSLDDLIPATDGLTFGETIAESDGIGAWWGQCTDAMARLERRLDLERAAMAIARADHSLCRGLSQYTPHELGEQKTIPRARIYRRIREMRLQLLAAGISSAE